MNEREVMWVLLLFRLLLIALVVALIAGIVFTTAGGW